MNEALSISTINPLEVAAKLDAVRNFLLPRLNEEIAQEPRLVEAMWFLQWVSVPDNYRGGLVKFAADLLERYADQVGPESLLQHAGKKLSPQAVETILKDFPFSFDVEAKILYGALLDSRDGKVDEDWKRDAQAKKAAALRVMDFAKLHALAMEQAREKLAATMRLICLSVVMKFSGEDIGRFACLNENHLWFFPRFWKCLFAWMDEHASQVKSSFAETSVTKDIFRWLELARESGKGVMFIGHSRFGKSRAIRSYARMYPGRVRVVECPSSSSESDLLRAVANALGIRFASPTTPLHEQRAAIEAVLREAGFLMIFDESQFLFPSSGKRAVPPRLNYVRRAIMDIGVPTAFIVTHQNWRSVEKNFLKASAYSIEQFEGRLLRPPIHLVDELTEEEMIEVARIHLPNLNDDFLHLVVTPIRTCGAGDHLSTIENIAIIAKSYAKDRARAVPRLDDLERAIADVLGEDALTEPGTKPVKTGKREGGPVVADRSLAPAGPVRQVRPPGFQTHRRETAPAQAA